MQMYYCHVCGTKLTTQYLKGEGTIPFCPHCDALRFPVYSTATSMIVFNQNKDKILLIQQHNRNEYILVAGYIDKGENAEETVKREVFEELGIEVSELHYNKSEYFKNSNTLMLNFVCTVSEEDTIDLSPEVDHAKWFSIDQAKEKIAKNSLAQYFLEYYLEKKK